MRECDDYYEYICVYVEDLEIAMREPQVFIHALITKYTVISSEVLDQCLTILVLTSIVT